MRVSLSITSFSWPGGPVTMADRLGAIAGSDDTDGVDTLGAAAAQLALV